MDKDGLARLRGSPTKESPGRTSPRKNYTPPTSKPRKKSGPSGSKTRYKLSCKRPLRRRGKMVQPSSSSIPSSPTRMKASPPDPRHAEFDDGEAFNLQLFLSSDTSTDGDSEDVTDHREEKELPFSVWLKEKDMQLFLSDTSTDPDDEDVADNTSEEKELPFSVWLKEKDMQLFLSDTSTDPDDEDVADLSEETEPCYGWLAEKNMRLFLSDTSTDPDDEDVADLSKETEPFYGWLAEKNMRLFLSDTSTDPDDEDVADLSEETEPFYGWLAEKNMRLFLSDTSTDGEDENEARNCDEKRIRCKEKDNDQETEAWIEDNDSEARGHNDMLEGTPSKSPPQTPTRMKASPSRIKSSPSYVEKKQTPQRHTPNTTPQVTPKREKVPYNVTPNCSSGLEMSPRKDYVVGQDVLARWTDGLFYLGTVKKVDEKLGRCYILFEDQSSFWVMFKDMMGSPNYNTELTCTLCSDGTSEEPNQIVICDRCGQGYHQHCHQPPIMDCILEPEVQWLCRQCIFANSVKRGGALKKGPNAKALQQMKLALPYETVPGCHALSPINLYTALLSQMNMPLQLTSLSWDSAHRTNKQECYCYCGGPGDWYLKMLQCCRCKQWFHEACVQCLENPMLYGDRFYLFVCSVCNAGPEYLQRMEMKWVDLAQLVLYNLSLTNKKKYQDFDNEIMPFINNNWDNLQLVRLEAFTRGERQEKVLDALKASKTRFACGKEVKKRKSIFGLRIRTPPVPPTIILPLDGPINEVTMNDLEMKGRKVKTFVPAQRLSESPVPLNRKRSLDLDDSDMDTKAKRARKLLEAAKTTLRVKSPKSANQSYTGYTGSGRMYGDNGLPSTSSLLDSIPHCDEATFDNLSSTKSIGSSSAPSVSDSTVSSCSSVPPSAAGASSYLVASRHHPSTSPSNRKSLSPKGKKSTKRGRPKKNIEKKWKSTGRKRGRPSKKDLYVGTSSESEDDSVVEPDVIKSMKDTAISMEHLRASVNSYFGAEGRLACGEKYTVLARRVTPEGKVQYLVQWEGFSPDVKT